MYCMYADKVGYTYTVIVCFELTSELKHKS